MQPAARFNSTAGRDWLSKLSNTDEWFEFDSEIPWIMIGGTYKRRSHSRRVHEAMYMGLRAIYSWNGGEYTFEGG
jgi:hypothetical protein